MKFHSFLIIFCICFIAVTCAKEPDLTAVTYNTTPFILPLKTPSSFPQMIIPSDNPLTVEGIDLGRHLFYDKILSSNGTMSCGSCHSPAGSFTDNKAVSPGVLGIFGKRSAMSLANIGYINKGLFWDGRVQTLEQQALLPIQDSIELHNNWDQVVSKIKQSTVYPTLFRKTFGISKPDDITKELAVKAIAQFERTLISDDAKVDRVFRREEFFTDDEFDGFNLFFNTGGAPDAQCGHCHTSPFYSSENYFNNGIDSANTFNDFRDFGRGVFTKVPSDNGKFRVPTLRNIELTAPYMHDGRFKTLEDVINHYASGGHYSPNIDPFIPTIAKINLTGLQKQKILAFLKTMTDTSFVKNPAFQSPYN